MMTHQDVVDRDVADRYAAGTLTADERAAFEEHYFACDECFAALQAAERLRDGVRELGRRGEFETEERAEPVVVPFPYRARVVVVPWLVAAASIVLAVAGTWIAASRTSDARLELAQVERRNGELERALKSTQASAAQTQLAYAAAEANVPLAILQATRSADEGTLTVPSGARRFIVWLEDVPARGATATLALVAGDGRILQSVNDLRPNSRGAMVASFSADSVAPGVYTLRLTTAASARPIAEYALKISR